MLLESELKTHSYYAGLKTPTDNFLLHW